MSAVQRCLCWPAAAILAAAVIGPAGCSKGREQARPASRPVSRPAAPRRIVVDEEARSVSVPARALRQGTYAELKGAIEYVLVAEGGKEYESLFATRHTPREIRDALARTGLRPGTPAEDDSGPRGKPLRILVEHAAGGGTVRRAVDELIVKMADGKPLAPVEWVYTGSGEATDPATGRTVLQASMTRSIVGLHHGDPSVLVQNPRPEAARENIYRANVADLPDANTPVLVVFQRVMPPIPAGTRRVQVFISGRVQGVGFRAFTQGQARRLGLGGFVRNLPDGRVEAVIEGPAGKVAQLLEKVNRGPRAARVEKVDVKDERPEGDTGQFEIRY